MFVTISPFYTIRNEANASFLIKVDKIINPDKNDFSVFSIPPFLGYILSHIGDDEYPKSITKISEVINVPSSSIKYFVEQLIENKDKKEFKISDSFSLILPIKLLSCYENKQDSIIYESPSFNGLGEYNTSRPSFPTSANLMVTTRCTTDCVYCYANRNLKPALKTEKLLNIIEELHSGGTVNLTLTGGDIFAHPDWEDILKCVRQFDYKPFLSTKTPLNYDQIKTLRELGYDEIQFSLDSIYPEILSKLIKVNSDYINKVETFFRDCSELCLDVQIRSVLTKINASKKHIDAQYRFLSNFRCIKEWDMTPAFFSPYKQQEYKSLEANNDDLIHVFEFSKRNDLQFKVGLSKINKSGYKLKKYDTVEEYICRNQICMANTTCLSILANGDCSICEMLYDNSEYLLGNVNDFSISDIWNSKKALNLYHMSQNNVPKDSPCHKCEVFDKCRNDFGKRVCYLDIVKYGKRKFDPDPRCPHAENVDLIL